MRILAISDWHHIYEDELEILNRSNFDACISCGDIKISPLARVKDIAAGRPCLGVAGNHDDWDTPEKAGVTNLHMNMMTIGNLNFVGLSGSSRYKNGRYFPMLEQEEAFAICKGSNFCNIDIFVSHDSLYRQHSDDLSHEGLLAVDYMLERYQPKIHVYGHHHISQDCMTKNKYGTYELCVYRASIIDTDTLNVEYLF